MKKIYLSDNEKHILIVLKNSDDYEAQRADFDLNDKDFDMCVRMLIARNIVNSYTETNEAGFLSCQLTPVGMAYLQFNPSLENPKTEKEIKKKNRKLIFQNRVWDIIKIILGAIIGAIITYFVSK